MSFDVQEAVFDVLDGVAAEAGRVAPDDVRIQHLFVRAETEATYVRIHYEVDHGRRLVTVERLIAIIVDES